MGSKASRIYWWNKEYTRFANLRHNKRLDRFTLRTQPKVNTQWNLYCLVHNIEKLAHHGYGT